MKLRVCFAFLTVVLLVISVAAQDSSVRLSPAAPALGISSDKLTRATTSADQLKQQLAPQDALPAYEQQMQMVFQKTCEELDAITQAVYNGNISREQAQYLSAERFELGMMQFQLLRTVYLSTAFELQKQSQSQSTELYVLGSTVEVPPPFSSADVPRQIANYLNLTPAQIAAIQVQLSTDRKQIEPLLERLQEQERELASAATSANFDEKQVRAIAAQQSSVLEQLVIANTRESAKLYSMLTGEQQARVDKLRQNSSAK